MKDVSKRNKDLVFPDSVVEYPRGKVGVPPGRFPETLKSKVLKSRNLYPMEGIPRAKLVEYKFDKTVEELRSKFGSSEYFDKGVLVD